jgi:esterase/lipase
MGLGAQAGWARHAAHGGAAARWLLRSILALAALAALPGAAAAAAKVGIVILHAALGSPADLDDVAKYLTDAGYVVDSPEVCWSKDRRYDKTYLDCLADIDPAVARLKDKGATAIVVAGFGLGGGAAIAYGARHAGLAGIIGLAPEYDPERAAREPRVAKSLALAIRLNEAGKGNQVSDFANFAAGKTFTTPMKARIYTTFFAAGSPGSISANMPKLTVPVLWVAGSKDRSQPGPAAAFVKAPKNPLSRYEKVAAGHADTPAAAKDAVLAWLAEVAAAH